MDKIPVFIFDMFNIKYLTHISFNVFTTINMYITHHVSLSFLCNHSSTPLTSNNSFKYKYSILIVNFKHSNDEATWVFIPFKGYSNGKKRNRKSPWIFNWLFTSYIQPPLQINGRLWHAVIWKNMPLISQSHLDVCKMSVHIWLPKQCLFWTT